MIQTKGEQHFVSKINCVFKITLFEIIQKKGVHFVLENKDFQKTWSSKLALISTLFRNPICPRFQKFCKSLPHYSSKISKLSILKSFGYLQTFSSKWFQTPCTHHFKTSFVQKPCLGKFIKWFEFLDFLFKRLKCS